MKNKNFIKNIIFSLSLLSLTNYSFANDELKVDNLNLDTTSEYGINPKDTTEVSEFFSLLPFEYSIKSTLGNGKNIMAMFFDANCPFCLRYEEELEKNEYVINATRYIFLVDLLPDPLKINDFIWCSKNPEKLLKSWYQYKNKQENIGKTDAYIFGNWKNENNLEERQCNSPVQFNKFLLSSLFAQDGKIQTPTTVFINGMNGGGVIQKDILINSLNYSNIHKFSVPNAEILNDQNFLDKVRFLKKYFLDNQQKDNPKK